MHPIRPSRPLHLGARPGGPILSAVLAAVLLAVAAGPATAQAPSGAGPAAAPTGGLSTRDGSSPWPALQLRLLPSVQERPAQQGLAAAPSSSGGSLLGSGVVADLYLSSSGLGPRVEGGFRATSGLLESSLGSGSGLTLRGRESAAPLPYVGIGYGGLMVGSGLSVQADLGLVASSGAVRLGRSLQSAPPVEDLVRDLRLAPVLRLGISYAF